MLPALVIPLAIMLLSYGTVWLAGLADIHIPDQFGGYPWSGFPLILFATFLGNIVTTSLGEELGWRGYWLPLLVRACGERRAYLINGFIHGVWHLPIIWLTGLYHSEQSTLVRFPHDCAKLLGPRSGYRQLAAAHGQRLAGLCAAYGA